MRSRKLTQVLFTLPLGVFPAEKTMHVQRLRLEISRLGGLFQVRPV
jgi:hypothetical protein